MSSRNMVGQFKKAYLHKPIKTLYILTPGNSKMFIITSKYFSFFNNNPPASWVVYITKNFLTVYSCLCSMMPYHLSQVYSEPIQKPKKEHFANKFSSWKQFFFTKCFILDVWPGSENAFVYEKLANSSICLIMSVRSPCYCKLWYLLLFNK